MGRFFTDNQLANADAARTNSINAGKMLPTRDTTDAIRHDGRGLKRWEGQRAALQSLGFQKTAQVFDFGSRGGLVATAVGAMAGVAAGDWIMNKAIGPHNSPFWRSMYTKDGKLKKEHRGKRFAGKTDPWYLMKKWENRKKRKKGK